MGTGSVVVVGDTIIVHYTGWLASNCQKFASSYDAQDGQPAQPFVLPLNSGTVIQGWVEGLPGMKAGGIRRLFVPAALAYGTQSEGSIPSNADLIFDVQVLAVQ